MKKLTEIWNVISPNHKTIVTQFINNQSNEISQLAKKLNLGLVCDFMPTFTLGGIYKNAIRGAMQSHIIKVNAMNHVLTQRVTAAHEICHFLLHADHIGDGVTDTFGYRSNLKTILELEAHRLAIEILLPRKFHMETLQFINYFDETSIADEAIKLRVSPSALKFRLHTLGLINLKEMNKWPKIS